MYLLESAIFGMTQLYEIVFMRRREGSNDDHATRRPPLPSERPPCKKDTNDKSMAAF
jgi:hypothetical protein